MLRGAGGVCAPDTGSSCQCLRRLRLPQHNVTDGVTTSTCCSESWRMGVREQSVTVVGFGRGSQTAIFRLSPHSVAGAGKLSGVCYKGTDPPWGWGWLHCYTRSPPKASSADPVTGEGRDFSRWVGGQEHSAIKSGVCYMSVTTKHRRQTLFRGRPGRCGDCIRLGVCLREHQVKHLTFPMKDGGSETRQRKSQKKTEADYLNLEKKTVPES